MKILILHQPFPMGNYRLMPYIAYRLQVHGHETVLAEQLNGSAWTQSILDSINSQNFDAAYFEMLDRQTFELIENSNINKKVLCYASKGIFNTFEDILTYKGRYYSSILTNSKEMSQIFSDSNICNEFFEYYPAPILDHEIVEDSRYTLPIVYLGGGFQRLTKPEYTNESKVIYQNNKVTKFGNGWNNVENYAGILPPDDIGKLYRSAKVSIGTVEPSQRAKGMINNRYSEMFKSGATVASMTYPELDFYGGEQFIQFVKSPQDLEKVIPISEEQRIAQKHFIEEKEKNFFNSLEKLLSL